ncbi:hypothetical protein EVAR_298_1 [Eumeta japonica]|uniref:Uncharacterized protein n=1 Tax=Eumeta variegata TaxID=151549 RepID=A0A4C1SBS7_EUMVA|nr:hypothetical protein EVAR_298_1 [Eumeta japonica]
MAATGLITLGGRGQGRFANKSKNNARAVSRRPRPLPRPHQRRRRNLVTQAAVHAIPSASGARHRAALSETDRNRRG